MDIGIAIINNYLRRLSNYFHKKLWDIGINYDEGKVPSYILPDPLIMFDGGAVKSSEEWNDIRRKEILSLFESHVYGRETILPNRVQVIRIEEDDSALDGLATRREITLLLNGKLEGPRLNILLYVPNQVSKPAPAFLGLNFYGNHTIHMDPGINITPQWNKANRNEPLVFMLPSDETRGNAYRRWPVEKIVRRGYALVTAYYGDIEPDYIDGCRYGVRSDKKKLFQSKANFASFHKKHSNKIELEEIVNEPALELVNDWGAIGVWAWGLRRIMDYIECDTDILKSKVILFGHSRLGKAALWAGAQDERPAIVISNNSGCVGAALSRRKYGETIRRINKIFPHWFCKKFKKYNGREHLLPIDQHMLIALIAPRPVYISSAEKDLDADPLGEFLSLKNADPVFNIFKLKGLGINQMPSVNVPVGETTHYHIRSGKHDVTAYDWDQYLHFVDRHIEN